MAFRQPLDGLGGLGGLRWPWGHPRAPMGLKTKKRKIINNNKLGVF